MCSRADLSNIRRATPLRAWAFVLLTLASAIGCSQSSSPEEAAQRDDVGDRLVVEESPQGAIVAVEEAGLGDLQVDVHGNSINVFAWAAWPTQLSAFDPFGSDQLNLMAGLSEGRDAGASLIAIDVEVCASQDQSPGTELLQARFELASGTEPVDEAAADLRTTMVFQPVVHPAFAWPAAGECRRGWQALEWRGTDVPAKARFTAVSMAEASFGDRWLYHWSLGDQGPIPNSDERIAAAATAVDQPLTFADGMFAGWAVRYLGWSEVASTVGRRDALNRQYFQPREGQRLVAVLLEVCAGAQGQSAGVTPALPAFGLQVEGWTLLAPAPVGEVWGPGYEPLAAPEPSDCTRGWLAFEAPQSVMPTGLFATDQYFGGQPHALWRFGEQLAAPEVGPGFPNALLMETAQALCGVTEPIEFTLGSGEVEAWQPASLVAVRESDSRVTLYASRQPLTADDIPFPTDAGTTMIQVVAENAGAPELIVSDYRDDFSSNLYGSIVHIDGALEGRFSAFLEATVSVDELTDDYICVTLSNNAERPTITGRIGAPLWSPS